MHSAYSKVSLGAVALSLAAIFAAPTRAQAVGPDGVIKVRSAYSVEESVARMKQDIAAKGILFFQSVDQAQLGAKAGIALRPSTLMEFGNPPLGVQFLTAKPEAGLDWPVRLLVYEDESGVVWAAWTDFAWIARRHGITTRDAQFRMASGVVQSITSTLQSKP
jgi:uncharacterized protein (DUF302 family)